MTHEREDSSALTFDTRLNAILRDWITPLLESQHFRRRKRSYEKQLDGLSWLVEVQHSHWHDATESQFTVNCGVYIPGVVSAYLNRPERRIIDSTDCCIHQRIGLLAEQQRDKWWELRFDDDCHAVDPQIGIDFRDRMSRHVFPFFDRFQFIEQVWQFLVCPRTKADRIIWPQSDGIALCYAAALASLSKRMDDVAACLDKAARIEVGSPIEEFVQRLKDRLLCDGAAK
jgi:hypothetical protein